MAIYGTNNSETIDASDGVTNNADTIYGYGGIDKIFGLGGNDSIVGGAGADEINGGDGTDTAWYTDSGEAVSVSLTTGLGDGGTAEGDKLTSIEILYGSAFNDTLAGNSGNNTLGGLQGDDTLKGGGGSDTLSGGADDDWLLGGAGGDSLIGGEGEDTSSYAASTAGVNVSLVSNAASGGDAAGDTFSGIENLTGSGHNDTLIGDDDVNELRGENGNDTLKGFGGYDQLWGGDGGDALYGMDGVDYLYGEAGDDTLHGGDNPDELWGGVGTDTLYGGDSPDDLYGEDGADHLDGGNGVDELYGGDGPDTLIGGEQSDTLDGGAGFDVLIGGGDNYDTLIGGADADLFVWSSTAELGTFAPFADHILDFNFADGDRMDLSGIDADVYAAGNQAFTFIGTAAFSGTPGEINYYDLEGDTYLQLQTGTSADVEGVIRLAGIHTPEASWFIL